MKKTAAFIMETCNSRLVQEQKNYKASESK